MGYFNFLYKFGLLFIILNWAICSSKFEVISVCLTNYVKEKLLAVELQRLL